MPILRGQTRDEHELLFWEHFGNRAIRCGKWKLVEDGKKNGIGWELYDMDEDRTELNNLSEENPKLVEELKEKYIAWAQRVEV